MIQIACNAVSAKLLNADRDTKLAISELLSYAVEGAEYTHAFKKGGWDGRSTFFRYKEALFPAGFVTLVHKKLRTMGLEPRLVRGRLPAPLGPERPKVDDFGDDERYDYQPETVNRLLKYGQMIAACATGGGKSRIAKMAVARIRRPTLFLTTRGVLMYQMKEHFEDAGFSCGVLGDGEWSLRKGVGEWSLRKGVGEWSLRKGVNVAMVQTIGAWLEDLTPETAAERILESESKSKEEGKRRRISDKRLAKLIKEKVAKQQARRRKMMKVLQYFEFVILEEAHEAGGNTYFEIMRHCKNAHYRLSLTATPFMRPDAEANMRLMACSGPIGIRVSEKMLIERGVLATPKFKYAPLPAPAGLHRSTGWQRAYKLGILENPHRNANIVFEAKRAASIGLSVMILIQRKDHGKRLKEMLTNAGVKARYIFGEHDQAARLRALEELKTGRIKVLIGSTILDVGVDVPAVGMIILGGGGKAEVQLRQRIGRGLRAKKTGPNEAFIVDFLDDHNRYLKAHARERREIVRATPGFAENILPTGGDFDFSRHGLSEAG